MDEKWIKEVLLINISQYDESVPSKHRRLSYDLGNNFDKDQIASLLGFVLEVNRRFPDIKMFLNGTGYKTADFNNLDQ